MEAAALFRVRKVLKLEDLKFSILLDESNDGETIVFDYGAIRGSGHSGCILYRDNVL